MQPQFRRPPIELEPPLLWPSVATPAAEAAAIKDLNADLIGVRYSVLAWDAALGLYQFARGLPDPVETELARHWAFIASRACAMELYHLKDRVQCIRSKKVKLCGASVIEHLDGTLLRKAAKHLDEKFPHIEGLRHAVAHAGANDTQPEQHAPDGRFGLTGFREGDTFSAPYKKSMPSLDISEASLAHIVGVVRDVFSSFEAAATALEQAGHAA